MDYASGITLVTVNYNSSKYVSKLLNSIENSLIKFTYPLFLEIIIVDNASNPNDYQQLIEITNNYSHNRKISIKIIRNKRNYGYSGGINLGVKVASHDIVIISNPDITFREDFFQRLSMLPTLFNSNYIIAPKILFKQTLRVNSKGLRIHAAGYGLLRGLHEQENEENEENELILSPHGALFISSKKILQELGPFDTFLHSFLEDLDLGIRAYLRGYRVVYIPYLVAFHEYGISWGVNLSSTKYYLSERNRLIILLRELPERFIAASLPFMLLSELISFVYAVNSRYLHLKAIIYADLLKNLFKILNEREKMKNKDYKLLLSILAKDSTWRFEHLIFENKNVLVVNRLYRGLKYITKLIWPWGN
ncbi:MAG: glycosyltransferase [Candidatus Methanomethylicia archaeon]